MMFQQAMWGSSFYAPEPQLDALLRQDDVTLAQVLDEEDDVLLEMKHSNPLLVAFLSRADVLRELLFALIGEEPPSSDDGDRQEAVLVEETQGEGEDGDDDGDAATEPDGEAANDGDAASDDGDDNTHDEEAASDGGGVDPQRMAYVAAELVAVAPPDLQQLISNDASLLTILFSFLDRETLDTTLTGYFRRVVGSLLQRNYDSMMQFMLRERIPRKLVDKISSYSLMELVVLLGWDESLGVQTPVDGLYRLGLFEQLLHKLSPEYASDPHIHSNVAQALENIVMMCTTEQNELLRSHLQSEEHTKLLLSHLFSECPSSRRGCLRVLIIIFQRFTHQNEFAIWGLSPGLSAAPPPVVQVCACLDKFHGMLAGVDEDVEPYLTQYGAHIPPLGETRLRVVELCLVLFRSNYDPILDELQRVGALQLIVDLLFAYPFHNILHGLVDRVVQELLSTDHRGLKRDLMRPEAVGLPSRIIAHFEAERLEQQRQLDGADGNARHVHRRRTLRPGNMGHLIHIANTLVQCHDPIVVQALRAPEWQDFVHGSLHEENERQQIVLGGARPTVISTVPDESDFDIFDMHGALNGSLGSAGLGGVAPGDDGGADTANPPLQLSDLVANLTSGFEDEQWDDDEFVWQSVGGPEEDDDDDDDDDDDGDTTSSSDDEHEYVVYNNSDDSSDDDEGVDHTGSFMQPKKTADESREDEFADDDGDGQGDDGNGGDGDGSEDADEAHGGVADEEDVGEKEASYARKFREFNDAHFWRASFATTLDLPELE